MSKYKKIYESLVCRAKSRPLENEVYYENHHIIPRSMGGDDSNDNMVMLTPREHFLCHLLLTKFLTGQDKHKMIWALHRMAFSKKYKITSRLYEYVRIQHINNLKENHPSNNAIWREKIAGIVREHWKNNSDRKKLARETMIESWSKGKLKPKIGSDNGMFGKEPWNKGKKLPGSGMLGSSNPAASSYKIVDKFGQMYYTDCLASFCRENINKPQPRNMRKVASGELKRHKIFVKVEKLEKGASLLS